MFAHKIKIKVLFINIAERVSINIIDSKGRHRRDILIVVNDVKDGKHLVRWTMDFKFANKLVKFSNISGTWT